MICRICAWTVELDDIVLRFPSGRVICSRCFHHEVEDELPLSPAVRRQIDTVEEDLRNAKLPADARTAMIREQ